MKFQDVVTGKLHLIKHIIDVILNNFKKTLTKSGHKEVGEKLEDALKEKHYQYKNRDFCNISDRAVNT